MNDILHTSYITTSGKIGGTSLATPYLNLSFCNIHQLFIPEGIQYLYCHNNYITELILPSTLIYLYCDKNKIKELILTENIKYVRCDINVSIVNIKDFINSKTDIYYI